MMSIHMLMVVLLVLVFADDIDEIGQRIWARIKFEYNYRSIRRSIKQKQKEEKENWAR